MADDRIQYEDALIRAHTAGDIEGARVIADEIKTRFMKPARSLPPAKSDPMLEGYSPLLETLRPFVTPGGMTERFRDVSRGIVQGAGDLAVGAGQLVSEGVGLAFPGVANRYRDAQRSREALYQGGRENPDLPDAARLTGELVASIPFAPAGAPSLLGRMKEGAKIGGALSLTSPVPASDDFWLAKGVQTAAGTAAGGIAPPIVEGVVHGVGATVNALRNAARGLANRATPQTIEATLRGEFQTAGVDWNAMSQQARQSMIAEVENALQAGGTINPEAIRRAADFSRVGATPLRGQLNRNPADYAREQNLARTTQGAPIAERLGQQNEAFISNVPAADPYATGQRVIGGLTARDAPRRSAVDAAYAEARDHLGRAAPMDTQQFSQSANLALDDQMLGTYLPTEVRTLLNRVSAGEIPFNVNTAVQMDRVLSAAQRSAGQGTPQSLAIGRVRDALNRTGVADNVGEDAMRVFGQARGMAAQRFGNIERTPALGAALDESVAPEKFIEKFAIRGEVNDVANFMRNLPNEGRQAARQGVIDWLRRQAVHGEGDSAKFSQAGFNRAMQTIGDRKLALIFAGDRQGLETLRALGRASGNAMNAPVASGVNYSNSANALIDHLDRAGSLPFLSALIGRPGDLVRSAQVTGALRPVPVTPAEPALSEELLRLIGRRGGVVGALSAPGVGTGILGIQ